MPLAIGVDLGGSHLAVGLVDHTGVLHELKEAKVDKSAPPESTLQLIADIVSQLLKNHEVCGIGIGLPGNHDSVHGICRFSPNFPSWHNVNVTPFLKKALQSPVYMLNDVRMATLGEFHFGAGQEVDNLVMLAIGTGIGGGVVVNGKLLVGKDEAAGEIGHMTIQPGGPLCNCGNLGCLEALASGPSIASRGKEAQSPWLKKKVASSQDLTAKVIAEGAQEGDEVCLRIFSEAGEVIGIAIANLAVTLNPDLVVLGGGVSLAGKILFEPVKKSIANHLHIFPAENVTVIPAKLGIRSGLIGAATYAFLQSQVILRLPAHSQGEKSP